MTAIDVSRSTIMLYGYRRCHSYRLAYYGASSHAPCRASSGMGRANISSCEKQVLNIFRIKTAIGNSVGRRSWMKYIWLAFMQKPVRMMIIHGPSSVSHQILESSFRTNILLG